MKSGDKKFLKDIKVIPSEEVFIQHKLVVCDINIRFKKEVKKPYVPRLKVWKLKDADTKEEFVSAIEEQSLADDTVNGVDECWEKLKRILLGATEKVCGRTKGPTQRKVNGGGTGTLTI